MQTKTVKPHLTNIKTNQGLHASRKRLLNIHQPRNTVAFRATTWTHTWTSPGMNSSPLSLSSANKTCMCWRGEQWNSVSHLCLRAGTSDQGAFEGFPASAVATRSSLHWHVSFNSATNPGVKKKHSKTSLSRRRMPKKVARFYQTWKEETLRHFFFFFCECLFVDDSVLLNVRSRWCTGWKIQPARAGRRPVQEGNPGMTGWPQTAG